jgi:hypothetical protein
MITTQALLLICAEISKINSKIKNDYNLGITHSQNILSLILTID